MHKCPACGLETISSYWKANASANAPGRCSSCGARFVPSGKLPAIYEYITYSLSLIGLIYSLITINLIVFILSLCVFISGFIVIAKYSTIKEVKNKEKSKINLSD
jgi:hypothetical protein